MDFLTTIFLAISLAVIMFGMGLSLRWDDFRQILRRPWVIILGLIAQLLILPLLGIFCIYLFDLSGTLAVGLFILAICPGGATSNLIAHLARADSALSVSLTAFSSTITVFSIPFLLNFALARYGLENGQIIQLPVLETFAQIFLITLLPVFLGMLLRDRNEARALSIEPNFRKLSVVLFVIIVLAAIFKQRQEVLMYFEQVGLPALTLNVLSMSMGFILGRIFFLPFKQSLTLAIETGIQNGTLGITIALTLLNNKALSIPSAIYSLIMFFTAYALIVFSLKIQAKQAKYSEH